MSSTLTLSVTPRALEAADIMFGGIWIGPGSGGERGDGNRPDPGQEAADEAVRAALDAGIVEFDTAPWYGAGASEERLGRAVQAMPNARIITKVGRRFQEPSGAPSLAGFDVAGRPPLSERVCVNDYSRAGTDLSLSESLDRMGVPAVLGLRIHDPNDNSNNNAAMRSAGHELADEVAQAIDPEGGMCGRLAELRAAGTIAHVGLGMNCNREAHQGVPDEVLRLVRGCPAGTFDSALLAGGWNLLSQAGLPCYAECEARGIAVHVAGVFASGLLVNPEEGTYAYKAAPPEMVERAARWGGALPYHPRVSPPRRSSSRLASPPILSLPPPPRP
eukprot:2978552-Prymnesium_polylepis.1